ncbi:hypothetical protein [Sporohalobacter salinus]|uniref:hypothetical protein n=1 Tax=Sporohalobacter salinus TaxID=1494606 RepID=UPI00195F93FA|nr:hypothetical protein [Sporohalobacter salinus]MBM7622520.1 hypothetical protein [Sporohalobacter salinus]
MSDQKVMKEAAKVYEENEEEMLDKQNVVGIGTGHKIVNDESTGEPCVTIFVSQKLDEDLLSDKDIVPKELSKFSTDVVEIGEVTAEELRAADKQEVVDYDTQSLELRKRPAMGGMSVGHYEITAGTIGTCVYDADNYPGKPDRYYILSNNHVLANSNDAKKGDPILQPGPHDGGEKPKDVIAKLSRYVPIKYKTENSAPKNYVDAAIAEGSFHDLDRQVYWVGNVKGTRDDVKVDEIVQKTGRTTSYTTGKVISTDATIEVDYGSHGSAKFAKQIVTTSMSTGGDSGSLVCDLDENAVGLLFAGSSRSTIINKISRVTKLLNIKLHP